MKQPWTSTFRFTLCALALTGASMASAQTHPAVQPGATATHGAMPHQPAKKMHHAEGKNHRAGTYATPQQHEAAAVAGERHKSAGAHHNTGAQQGNQLERNALRRCEIFKTDDDRRACVERVRQPQISGSVEGGGVIREYTQTVQVPAAPAVQYNGPPPVEPARMLPPPVEPMRKY